METSDRRAFLETVVETGSNDQARLKALKLLDRLDERERERRAISKRPTLTEDEEINEGAALDACHRLADVVLEIIEGLRRPFRLDARLLLDPGAEAATAEMEWADALPKVGTQGFDYAEEDRFLASSRTF